VLTIRPYDNDAPRFLVAEQETKRRREEALERHL